jgi:hypothetical protein
MGAGASAQTEQAASASSPPKVKPTRTAATEKSLSFVCKLLRDGIETHATHLGASPAPAKGKPAPGVLWGDGSSLYVGRSRTQKADAQVRWDAAGVAFAADGDVLTVTSEATQFRVELKGKQHLAGWLATYLHAFLPGSPTEYTVSFEEWGRLGIAFAVFLGVVIPVVFQVEEPATSLGVEPASILVALNGTDIASLPPETDMLDFISNADFPKTCVFRRPLLSL